jgi:hypothetical protein
MSFEYKGRIVSIEDFYNGNIKIGREQRPLVASDLSALADISSHEQTQQYGMPFAMAFGPEVKAQERQFIEQSRKEAEEALTDSDRQTWTVINLLPFPLNVDGIIHNRLTGPDGKNQVPSCEIGERFSFRTFTEVVWSLQLLPVQAGQACCYQSIPHTPKKIAEEYMSADINGRQLRDMIICGAFSALAYSPNMPSWEAPQFLDSPRGRIMLGKAQWLRNEWFLQMYENGELAASLNKLDTISDIWKKAAEVLVFDKVLDELPQWAR